MVEQSGDRGLEFRPLRLLPAQRDPPARVSRTPRAAHHLQQVSESICFLDAPLVAAEAENRRIVRWTIFSRRENVAVVAVLTKFPLDVSFASLFPLA